MRAVKIIWTDQAKSALKRIYNFYKERSQEGANHVRSDLLSAPKKIVFSKQYQIDDINPKYRRIVIRDHKILYKENKGVVSVIDIIGTRESPEILKKK